MRNLWKFNAHEHLFMVTWLLTSTVTVCVHATPQYSCPASKYCRVTFKCTVCEPLQRPKSIIGYSYNIVSPITSLMEEWCDYSKNCGCMSPNYVFHVHLLCLLRWLLHYHNFEVQEIHNHVKMWIENTINQGSIEWNVIEAYIRSRITILLYVDLHTY